MPTPCEANDKTWLDYWKEHWAGDLKDFTSMGGAIVAELGTLAGTLLKNGGGPFEGFSGAFGIETESLVATVMGQISAALPAASGPGAVGGLVSTIAESAVGEKLASFLENVTDSIEAIASAAKATVQSTLNDLQNARTALTNLQSELEAAQTAASAAQSNSAAASAAADQSATTAAADAQAAANAAATASTPEEIAAATQLQQSAYASQNLAANLATAAENAALSAQEAASEVTTLVTSVADAGVAVDTAAGAVTSATTALDLATAGAADLLAGVTAFAAAAAPVIIGAVAGAALGISAQAAIEATIDWGKQSKGDECHKPKPYPALPPNFNDPLVLDLRGAGIALTTLDSSGAYFDYRNNGVRDKTGWISSGEGILISAPADGASVTAENLLGAVGGSGFADLSAFDTNGDGIVDANDAGFANLRVWIDNGDGLSNANEIFTLSQLGITAINLNAVAASKDVGGNTIAATSTFSITDAASGTTSINTIAEVNFQNSTQHTIVSNTDSTTLTQDALNLPNLDGFGSLPDLNVAVSLDPTLETMVHDLVLNSASMTGAQFDAAFQTMVLHWAGADDVDPTSAGAYVDARHMAVIYAYFGIDPSIDTYYQQQPNGHNGPAVWEAEYSTILNVMKTRFVSQIAQSLKNYGLDQTAVQNNPYFSFTFLGYDPATNTLPGDFAATFSAVSSLAASATDASVYWGQVLPILEALRYDLDPSEGESVNSLVAYAALAGMPTGVLVQFATDLGLTVQDEGAITGSIIEGDKNFVLIGTGDKTIVSSGSVGTSTFVYDPTGGDVTLTGTVGDTIVLRGLGSDDIRIELHDGKVAITILSTGKQLQLADFLNNSPAGVIALADGTRIESDQVFAFVAGEAARVFGVTSQNDSLADAALATLGLTVVRSASGSTMVGGGDYNVYEPAFDQGAETIDCNGLSQGNMLRLGSGIDPSGIQVRQSADGENLIITVASTGKQIILAGQGGAPSGHIAFVSFANGTLWSATDLWAASSLQQTADNASVVYGAYSADQLVAGSGAVTLIARDSGATLTSGAGADKLETVGKGNTIVLHSDTTTAEILSNGADFVDTGLNVLKLADGVTAADVTVSQADNPQNLILTLSTGQIITLDRALSGEFASNGAQTTSFIPVDQVQFSDGASWTWQDLIDRSIATMEARGDDTVFDGDSYGLTDLHAGSGTVTLDASKLYTRTPLTLTAGTGSDTLIGGSSDTTYVVGVTATDVTITKLIGAQQQISGIGINNVLSFGNGVNESDIVVSADPSGRHLTLTNIATGATVKLVNQLSGTPFDTIESVAFADGVTWSARDLIAKANASNTGTILGTSGDDTLIGTTVAETLSGKGGNDTLVAGSGNTLMAGGAGSDTYVVDTDSGPVTIDDAHDQVGSSSDRNVLRFGEGIAPADVIVTQSADGRNINITDPTSGQKVAIVNQLSTGSQFDQIALVQFSDGTVWSQEDLLERAVATMVSAGATVVYGDNHDNTIVAGDGDRTIFTGQGADHVIAGAGNQTINQVSGNGIVEISSGAFNYVVSGSHQATVMLHGINPANIVVSQANAGEDLVLRSTINGEVITLAAQLEDRFQIVSQVVFDDGTIWTSEDLTARSIVGAEALQAPTIYGDANANEIAGGSTDQTLIGGLGNDTLIAGTGNDILIGGTSGNERDTFVVNAAAGNVDIIGNTSTYLGTSYTDTLQFGPGIDQADINVMQSNDGTSIVLTNSVTGKSVTLENALQAPRLQVAFDDGTVWSPADLWSQSLIGSEMAGAPVIYGDATDNVLAAGSYDMTLVGNGGDDTFISGTGDATFEGSFGSNLYQVSASAGTITIENAPYYANSATVAYTSEVNPADIQVRQSANGRDLLLTNVITEQTVVLKDQIASEDPISGGGGSGPLSLETLDGSAPLLSQTMLVTFGDGTSWTAEDLLEKSISQGNQDGFSTIYGDRNSNTLLAGDGLVTLIGQGGDDTFINGNGDDTFIGSNGREIYNINKKSGTDTIVNASGLDSYNTVVFGAEISPSDIIVSQGENGQDLILSDSANGQMLVLQGQIDLMGDTSPSQTAEIEFADGTIWSSNDILNMSIQSALSSGSSIIYGDRNDNVLQAGDGNVTLIGQGGNDTLTAGAGDDTLIGGGNYTTYQISSAPSSDVIEAQQMLGNGSGWPGGGPIGGPLSVAMLSAAASVNDVMPSNADSSGELDLTGIDSTNVQVTAGANGADVILNDVSTGQIITILNQLSSQVIQTVNFDNGTSWSSSDLYDMIYNDNDGSSGPPALPPGNYYGTDGDDSFSLTTDFTVDGGLGNDYYAVSGNGGGTFYFAKGDGNDALDTLDGAARDDMLSFTNVNSNEVSVSLDPDAGAFAVTFKVDDTGDSLLAYSQLYGDQPGTEPLGIENIQFADGVVWDRNEIRNRSSDSVIAVVGDDLSATSDSEIFDVSGMAGNRIITGFDAASESHDYVQVNRSTFTDWAHLLGATQQVGNDLVITLDPTDSITLKDVALANFSSNDVKFVGSVSRGALS
jgi:Ca2+-binding RTX toxin-like protein